MNMEKWLIDYLSNNAHEFNDTKNHLIMGNPDGQFCIRSTKIEAKLLLDKDTLGDAINFSLGEYKKDKLEKLCLEIIENMTWSNRSDQPS